MSAPSNAEILQTNHSKVSKTWCFTLNNPTDADEKFFADIEVTYCVVGKEGYAPVPQVHLQHASDDSGDAPEVPATTPHLQGYIIFKRAYRFKQLKKLNNKCHWEPALVKDAMNYCMKEGNYTVRDNRAQGKRNDFAAAAELIAEHSTKRQMLLDPRLYSMMARYGQWATTMQASRLPKKVDMSSVVLRPWQETLMKIVSCPPDDRKVHWFFDEKGGQGKSFMTKILLRNYDGFLACGKKVDTLYAYKDNLSQVCIFDLTRSQEGEYCPYSTMETLKDGDYLSTKYQSIQVLRDHGTRIIVFANFRPDKTKMSDDRWDVHVLGSYNVVAFPQEKPLWGCRGNNSSVRRS